MSTFITPKCKQASVSMLRNLRSEAAPSLWRSPCSTTYTQQETLASTPARRGPSALLTAQPSTAGMTTTPSGLCSSQDTRTPSSQSRRTLSQIIHQLLPPQQEVLTYADFIRLYPTRTLQKQAIVRFFAQRQEDIEELSVCSEQSQDQMHTQFNNSEYAMMERDDCSDTSSFTVYQSPSGRPSLASHRHTSRHTSISQPRRCSITRPRSNPRLNDLFAASSSVCHLLQEDSFNHHQVTEFSVRNSRSRRACRRWKNVAYQQPQHQSPSTQPHVLFTKSDSRLADRYIQQPASRPPPSFVLLGKKKRAAATAAAAATPKRPAAVSAFFSNKGSPALSKVSKFFRPLKSSTKLNEPTTPTSTVPQKREKRRALVFVSRLLRRVRVWSPAI